MLVVERPFGIESKGPGFEPKRSQWFSLSLGGLAMFVAVQDPGKKSQVFVPRRGGAGKENVENFLGGGRRCLV